MVNSLEYDIESILSRIGINYTLEGAPNKVAGVSPIEEATENDLSFCSSKGQDASVKYLKIECCH